MPCIAEAEVEAGGRDHRRMPRRRNRTIITSYGETRGSTQLCSTATATLQALRNGNGNGNGYTSPDPTLHGYTKNSPLQFSSFAVRQGWLLPHIGCRRDDGADNDN